MKKIYFMLLAVVAMVMMPSTMMAASLNEAAPMSVVKAGNISGTLDVQMGSHTNTFTNFRDLTVTENSDNTINITINNLQIGSMPGKISVNAKNVPLDGTTDEYTEVVTFKFLGTSYYNADIMAKKNDDGKLYFEITTKDATYLGVPFTAIVKFTQN